MMHKKNNLIFAMAFMWVTAGMLLASEVLAAADDLMVDFEATPLFSEANFLPGSEVSRWVKVKNNTPGTKPIIVEAINESDPDGLAGVFEIGIYEGGIQRYATATLATFFSAGEVSFSDVAGGGTQTQYDFLVRFVPDVNNSYQEKSLGFDILIGFKGDDGGEDGGGGNGGGGGGDGGNGGGGGGGGGFHSGLVIQNEASVDVTNTTATITWNTSFNSTSRVVYGTTAGVFDFNLPSNYGYPFSTLEFDTPANLNGVTLHSITLTGLTTGMTYYFRTISHASPDTISKEVSFTTVKNSSNISLGQPISGSNVSAHSENVSSSGVTAFGDREAGAQEETENPVFEDTSDANSLEEPLSGETSQNTANDNSNQFAAAFLGIGANMWWLLLVLILLVVIYLVYRKFKSDK